MPWKRWTRFPAFGLIALVIDCSGQSTPSVPAVLKVVEFSPNVLIFATSSGNVVASVGRDGALLVGTPSVASTPEISDILARRTDSTARYVVIYPEPTALSEGDADWGRRGAFVAMQEKALERLGGHVMGPRQPLPSRLLQLRVDRPRIAFSEVLTFDLNGEAVHIVHQPSGYSDADAVTHFHIANLIYLGEVFPGDGYPDIDSTQGGRLDGLLKQLVWTDSRIHIVPARGPITTGTDVEAFKDMLLTVRDRVQQLIAERRTEDEVIADHPTREFDARWGHGRIKPDEFVRELYTSLGRK